MVQILVTPQDQFYLIYALPLLQLLPRLLCRTEMEAIQVILIAINLPRRMWYLDVPILLADSLGALLDCLDLLPKARSIILLLGHGLYQHLVFLSGWSRSTPTLEYH